MASNQVTEDRNALGTDAQVERLYAIGGILLILAGMVFGELYAIFILHPNIDSINGALALATQAVAEQNADEIWAQFSSLGGYLENAGTKKDTHVHILHAGYLALILTFVQHKIALSDKTKLLLAKIFLASSIILPVSIFLIHYVGLIYSPLTSIGWASIFADLSGLALAIVMIIQIFGFLKKGGNSKVTNEKTSLIQNPASRILLKAGSLLILIGFVVGALHAGFNVEHNEKAELNILTQLVEQAAAKDLNATNETLAAYGMLQGERALTIAAHAHIVEFGLLAIMLALIQPYIFLSQSSKYRLAIMLIVGSICLPIAVYSELWFGLLAGGVADFAGLLVIVAIFGMLGGVLRFTGSTDKHQGELQ